MKKNKIITAAVTVGVFLLLLIGYLAVVRPIVNKTEETKPIELVEGEVEGPNGRVLMFPHVERKDIDSIEVHNFTGEYKFTRVTENGETTFMLDGFNGIAYQDEAFAQLVVSAGYTIAMERVTDKATAEDYATYGLDEPQAYWILTGTDKKEYRVNVGDELVSGTGYYAALEGRDCIYVLSSNIKNSILAPAASFIDPIVCVGLTQESYMYVDNFTVLHGDDVFVSVKQCTKEEFVNPDAMAETKLAYPAGYKTDDTFFLTLVSRFISLLGEETVYLGHDEAEFAKYGLDDPYYTIFFQLGENYQFLIYVSELQEDGCYYAMTNLTGFQTVVRCAKDTFSWLEYDLTHWVDDKPIMYNITYIDRLTVNTGDEKIKFELNHGTDEDGKATLEVSADNGFEMTNSDVYNFREFYKVLLSVQLDGAADLTDEEKEKLIADDGNLVASVIFRMNDGTVNEYAFYRYSTRRALMTVNGSGEFYVKADWIEKIVSDLDRLQRGLEIDSSSKI